MAKAKVSAKKKAAKPAGDKPKRGKFQDFPTDQILFHPALQPRKGDGSTPIGGIYRYHVDDLRAAITKKDGDDKKPPAVRLWKVTDRDGKVYCTDGHHTTIAYREEGKKAVPAEVFEGTWLEAVADASGANEEHKALKRTHEDKRQAVLNLLNTLREEGVSWTNKRVAQTCHVGDDLVKSMLLRLPAAPDVPKEGSDGRTYGNQAGRRKTPRAPKVAAPVSAPRPAEPAATPEPAPSVTPPAPPPPVTQEFHFADFNAKYGAMERQIDLLGAQYGRQNGPRADGLRKLLREWKADLFHWQDELKAADERERGKGR